MSEKISSSAAENLVFLLPLSMFGIFGAVLGFLNDKNPLMGLFWGLGIGLIVLIGSFIVIAGGKWIENGMEKGALFPYLLVGFVVAIAISGLLAFNLGKPSCEESNIEPYSSCSQYADDGFEATSAQKWNMFWSTLPFTIVIASTIAVFARNKLR